MGLVEGRSEGPGTGLLADANLCSDGLTALSNGTILIFKGDLDGGRCESLSGSSTEHRGHPGRPLPHRHRLHMLQLPRTHLHHQDTALLLLAAQLQPLGATSTATTDTDNIITAATSVLLLLIVERVCSEATSIFSLDLPLAFSLSTLLLAANWSDVSCIVLWVFWV